MNILLISLFGFFLGSLPFSVWLGRLFLHDDVRRYGADHNPGAANAWRAGKWKLGVPVLLLDFLKGAIPTGIARWGMEISGWGLLPVALAPVLGHVFSPFLGFHGGKGLAVTFGVWTGLTAPSGPFVLGAAFGLGYFLLAPEVWSVMSGMLLFLPYLLLSQAGGPLLLAWTGNLLVLLLKYRHELRQPLRLKTAKR
jgi:acyl phosphate:glycerol-3-phosphate acyltransferase